MGGYPNHVKSLKGLVFQETVESCRWRNESRNLNSRLKQLLKITTASLRGGWVPKTSWSFHYWQPAPRWRLHRWLAKPGKPAMSPHAHPEDLRAEMARREGLVVPASQSPQLPVSSGTQRPQRKYVMYGELVCTHYISYHLHTYYVLYKDMHRYTGLYTPIHSYTKPYKAIQTYTMLYRAIRSYAQLHRTILSYTGLYGAIHSNTGLYTSIQRYKELYRPIQGYTQLYRAIRS